jgi:glycerophosphoryl diester phosphodiesterase
MRRFRAVLVLAALALLAVPAAPAVAHGGRHRARSLDLEAHRGGRGLRPENTLASFGNALQLGVTTLELDTGITKDGQVLVTHEPRILSLQCQDTGSNHFVGQLVKDLTLAQAKTLDCGTRHPTAPNDEFVGTQDSVPGTRMPTLDEVFDLAERYGARNIQFNIETKIDPTAPNDTVDPDTFTRRHVHPQGARRHPRASRGRQQPAAVLRLAHARDRAPARAAPAPRGARRRDDDLPRPSASSPTASSASRIAGGST